MVDFLRFAGLVLLPSSSDGNHPSVSGEGTPDGAGRSGGRGGSTSTGVRFSQQPWTCAGFHDYRRVEQACVTRGAANRHLCGLTSRSRSARVHVVAPSDQSLIGTLIPPGGKVPGADNEPACQSSRCDDITEHHQSWSPRTFSLLLLHPTLSSPLSKHLFLQIPEVFFSIFRLWDHKETTTWKRNLSLLLHPIHQFLALTAFVTMETGLGASLSEAPPTPPNGTVGGCGGSSNWAATRVCPPPTLRIM